MNVHGMTLLEQSVELRHPGGKAGSEFGSVEVLDRDVGKRQAGIEGCVPLVLDPTLSAILVRLEAENGGDLLRFQFQKVLVNPWMRTESEVGQDPGAFHGQLS
jgi:hypothetical protein